MQKSKTALAQPAAMGSNVQPGTFQPPKMWKPRQNAHNVLTALSVRETDVGSYLGGKTYSPRASPVSQFSRKTNITFGFFEKANINLASLQGSCADSISVEKNIFRQSKAPFAASKPAICD